MKIVNIDGGLGNQMFKYAFALVLKQKHPDQKILIDSRLCRYRKPKAHQGYELNKLFNLQIKEANIWQIYKTSKRAFGIVFYKFNKKLYKKYITYFYDNKDKHFVEDYSKPSVYNKNLVENKESLYYDVSGQSWLYFEKYITIIKKAFMFKVPLDNNNQNLFKKIKNCNSVAIHFRLGDYMHLKNFNVCSNDYYIKAINYVKNKFLNPHYYIFTNDFEFFNKKIKDQLNMGDNIVTYVNNNIGENSYKDIILMSNCKCVIMANSSFSWWAAWLNDIPGHEIIAPKIWLNNSEYPDICPDYWLRL
jgi:hypothetical protein